MFRVAVCSESLHVPMEVEMAPAARIWTWIGTLSRGTSDWLVHQPGYQAHSEVTLQDAPGRAASFGRCPE